MKILLLTHYYPPERGAAQYRWSVLAEHFIRDGHSLHVVAPAPHYPLGQMLPGHEGMVAGSVHVGEHGESVHRVAFRPYDDRVRSRMLDEAVTARDVVRTVRQGLHDGWAPDVVIATVPTLSMVWAGRRVARLLERPLVLDLRDAWPDLLGVAREWDDHGAHGIREGARHAARSVLRGAGYALTREQRRADAVVTTTESFAEVLRSRGMRSVRVIRNAAHAVPGCATHEMQAATPAPLHVLYAGTVGRAHGLASAVQAVSLLHERGVDIILRILGQGADLAHLKALATGLRAPVEFMDPVPRSAMGEQYAWTDSVLVSLRPWSALEVTVPSKLYEIMGLGVHVSGVLAGEAARIVEQTGAGSVTAPGDVAALAASWELLQADRTRLEVSGAGREWVEQYADAARLAESYCSLLEEVAARE